MTASANLTGSSGVRMAGHSCPGLSETAQFPHPSVIGYERPGKGRGPDLGSFLQLKPFLKMTVEGFLSIAFLAVIEITLIEEKW